MITFQSFCIEDEVDFRLNGHPLDIRNAEIEEPVRGTYWFKDNLDAAELRRGNNLLEIKIKKAEKTAGFTRSVTGVEILTRYKDPERPISLNPSRMTPPS